MNQPAHSTNGISVVIAAYNSKKTIKPTLEALARCRLPADAELILVDNNSTDGTAEYAVETWEALGRKEFPLRVVTEKTPGVVYARRAGAQAARFSILTYCDDDNVFSPDYLEEAWRIMEDETVGAVGGGAVPSDPQRLPAWFYPLSWGYAVGAQVPGLNGLEELAETGRCEVNSLWTAGLTVRKKALDTLFRLEHFPVLTGRREEALTSGEDTEITFCLTRLGYRVLYSDSMRFEHNIDPDRITLEYANKLFKGFDGGFEVFRQYRQAAAALDNPLAGMVVGMARVVKHTFTGALLRGSFLSLLAALRLTWLMSDREKHIFDNLRQIRQLRRSESKAE